jgi:glycosyltransferase involved in cell wall biosynthesis
MTTSRAPRLSVLMPVYNGEKHLREAIEGVLRQSMTDFELIVVDDGSTDATPTILSSYGDSRIAVSRHEPNQGIAVALNRGLALAQAEFIARQDADDVSLPFRFERQIRFLETHRDTGLVGAACARIDEDGRELRPSSARMTTSEHLKWNLLFANQFTHTSVMFRRSVADLAGRYSCADEHAEDYGLWSRMARTTRVANLPDVLVKYRESEYGVTRQHAPIMMTTVQRISGDNIRWIVGREIDDASCRLLQHIGSGRARHLNDAQWNAEVLALAGCLGAAFRTLLERFCDALLLRGTERAAFRRWARQDFGRRVLGVATSRLKRSESAATSRRCSRLYVAALKLDPLLSLDGRTARVALRSVVNTRGTRRRPA